MITQCTNKDWCNERREQNRQVFLIKSASFDFSLIILCPYPDPAFAKREKGTVLHGNKTAAVQPVLRIRIHRIHMFLGLLGPDPDPLVRGMDPKPDPDPSIIKKK
jgi:hypothetical protein